VPAIYLFCEHLLEDVLVLRKVGYEFLQFAVLFFELAQTSKFGESHPFVLALLPVERLLGYPHLPTDLGDRGF
jgi:hypothetical protein